MNTVELWREYNHALTLLKAGERIRAEKILNNLRTCDHTEASINEFNERRMNFLDTVCRKHGLLVNANKTPHNVDNYITFVQEGVSLVTCCMNRNDNLVNAMY